MIYKGKFNLTGTTKQQFIVSAALEKIMFPWERLKLPNEPVEIGWTDLNNGMFKISQHDNGLPHVHTNNANPAAPGQVKKHEGEGHPEGDGPEPLLGRLNGRLYILGVFYPGSGRIYVDNALVDYPELAQSTVSAEIAHSVDEFLPLTDQQRAQIMALMHPGGPDAHTWWEKVDYSAEYYSLIGESFMQAFTIAYSDMPFGNTDDFVHSLKYEQVPEFKKIVGIERTDLPAVPDPVPAQPPVQEPPTPAPVQYEHFKGSKVYHSLDHYDKREGEIITDVTGLRPCKICKP